MAPPRLAATGTYLSWILLSALVLTTFAFVIRQFVSFSFLVGQGFGTTSLDASLLGREPMHSNMHPLVDLVDEHGLLPSHKFMKHPIISFGLHIALAPIWATLSITQLIPSLRSSYPAAHRICGRVFLLISLSLGVTGFLFLWLDMAFTHQDETSHWIHPFTLTGISVPLVAAFLVSGALAVHHARARRFAVHRAWILRHMAIGYSVIVMRWILALASIVYPLVFDMPSPGSSGVGLVELRKILFGLAMWVGAACSVIAVEVYLRIETRSSALHKLRNT